jgi:serine/threonine protein kinase
MNEEKIFHQALARSRPEERAAYLEEACAGNAALRASVEALLRANVGASSFMDRPPPDVHATVDEPAASERPGTVIRPYKLLEQIGEGGFGVVFMAEQQHPVRRKVALKVLKPGMDSRQVVARFEAERQALALMDHPNIAKVLDGGQTDGGRPFFVMDLVKGVPITEYCDHNQLTTRERLELFISVCRAVQHAHQKGVIHRDLKPSNVLVTVQDGAALAKVIDFGIAKALGQQLTDKTLFTGFAQLIGTPLYMSPEQAALSNADVDTRSDVYSLGVLLYELLTGTTPLDRERLKEVGYDEMRRIIREEEPSRPSTRISTLGQAATTVCTCRKSDARQLSRLFRGELDWIVLKALEKDRNRRYESAGAFAADVERYLHDEPVLACPPTAWYRFGKFARRHKMAITVGCLALAVLLTVLASVTVNYRLTHAAYDSEAEQRRRAEANFHKAVEAVELMLHEVEAGEPETGGQPHLDSVRRRLVGQILRFFEGFLQDNGADPRVRLEAGMAHRRVGYMHYLFGNYDKAEKAYRDGLPLLETLAAELPAESVCSLELALLHLNRGVLFRDTNRPEEARQAFEQAGTLLKSLVSADPREPVYQEKLAVSHHNLSVVSQDVGRLRQAEQAGRAAVAIGERLAADYPKRTYAQHLLALYCNNLALLLERTGRPQEAERLYRQGLNQANTLAAQSPEQGQPRYLIALLAGHLGALLHRTERPREASEALRQSLQRLRELPADLSERPEARGLRAGTCHNLALLLMGQNQQAEAEGLFGEARQCLQDLTGKFPDVPGWHSDLANVLNDQALASMGPAQRRRARTLLERALDQQQLALRARPANPVYRQMLWKHHYYHAAVLGGLGRAAEAREEYRQTVAALQRLTAECPDYAGYKKDLADACYQLGWALQSARCYQEAEPVYRQAVRCFEGLARQFPGVSYYQHRLGGVLHNLAECLRQRGERKQARQLLEQAIEHQRNALVSKPLDPTYLLFFRNHYMDLTLLLRALGLDAEAEQAYRQFIQHYEKLSAQAPDNPALHGELGACLNELAMSLMRRGQWAEAQRHLQEAIRRQQHALKLKPGDAQYTRFLRSHYANLAQVFARLDDHVAAAHAVEQTARLPLPDWQTAFQAIAPLRLCVAAAARDSRLSEAQRRATAQRYRNRIAALYREAARHHPDVAAAQNAVAWSLATCADPASRDHARAVELAEKAVAQAPRNGAYWNTLGVARYRAGDAKGTVEALQKSITLQQGGDSADWLFLAMAQQKLGRSKEARTWYDKAVGRPQNHEPEGEEFARFRTEAEELLGLKRKP